MKMRIINICWFIILITIVIVASLQYRDFIKTYGSMDFSSSALGIIVFWGPYALLLFMDTLIWTILRKNVKSK